MTTHLRPRILTLLAICHLVVAVAFIGLLIGLHRPVIGIGTSKTYVRAERAMDKAIEDSAAGSWLLTPIHAIGQLIAPVLLLAAGVALLFGKSWGRNLALGYALVSLLDNLCYGGALHAVYWSDGPALQTAMAAEHVGTGHIEDVVRVQTPAMVVGILYPLFVLWMSRLIRTGRHAAVGQESKLPLE